MPGPSVFYACQRVEVDLARRELIVQGVRTYIGDRAFEVLGVLVRSAGQLVTKDELMRRVWPGAAAGENTLEVHVSALRKALGPERRLLKTTYARGYRLLGSWTAVERAARAGPASCVPGDSAPFPQHPADRWLSAYRPHRARAATAQPAFRASRHYAHRCWRDWQDATGTGGRTPVDRDIPGQCVARRAVVADRSQSGAFRGGTRDWAGLSDDESSAETVAQAIGDERMLLVLDNCEHVIDAAAELTDAIVRLAPRTTVLATSREVLRVHGEHVVRVPPLDIPYSGSEETSQLLACGAVELFVALTRMYDSSLIPQNDGISGNRSDLSASRWYTASHRVRRSVLRDARRSADCIAAVGSVCAADSRPAHGLAAASYATGNSRLEL